MAEKTSNRRIPKFRRRAEARPEEVLDAALQLFTQKGFAATRVEDIAKLAGISKGSVYLYFPSKEALLEGLVRRAVVPVANNALEMAASFDGNPRVIITMMLSMVAIKLEDPNLIALPKVIMREALVAPKIAAMYRKEVLDRVLPAVEQLIKKGIDEGYFRDVDPELTVRSVIGPLLAHITIGEIFGIVPKDGLAIDRLIENHLTILFDGLSARKGDE